MAAPQQQQSRPPLVMPRTAWDAPMVSGTYTPTFTVTSNNTAPVTTYTAAQLGV